MANNITTQVTITAKDMASSVFKNVGNNIKSTGSNIKTFVADNMQAGGIAAAGLAASVSLVARNAVTMAANFEQSEIAFTTLLKDRKKAIAAIKEIEKDAKSTPYNLPDLIRANQLLISAGVSTGDARNQIKALGNAIAATGGGTAELNRLSVNLQQIKAVGKASALDIKQFAYAGINIYQLLADVTGKNVKEVKDMEVSYELLTQALDKASQKGGAFAGAMDNQSKSFQGLMANIQDVIGLTLKDIAVQSGLFDAVKSAAQKFLKVLETGTPHVVKFIKTITENKTAMLAIAGAIGGLLVLAIGALIATFAGAIAVMALFGAIGAGVVVAAVKMYEAFQSIKPALEGFVSSASNAFETFKAKVASIYNAVVAAFTGMINFFINIPNLISQMVASVVATFNGMVAYMQTLPGTIMAFLGQLFIRDIPYAFGYMVGYLIAQSINVVIGIISFFQQLPGNLANIWKNVVDITTNLVSNLKNFLLFKAIEIVVGMISFFQQLPGNVSNIFNNMRQIAVNIVSGMVSSVVSFFNSLLSNAISIFNSVRNAVASAIQGAKDAMVGNVNSWPGAFSAAISSIPGIVSGIFGQLGGIIGGALSNAYNIAVGWLNSLKNIWNQIISGAQSAANAASGSTSTNSTSTKSLSLMSTSPTKTMSSMSTFTPEQPKPSGNITFTVNIGMYAGSESEKRNIAMELFKTLEMVAHSQSKTVSELLAI